jgi:hypothetical protein
MLGTLRAVDLFAVGVFLANFAVGRLIGRALQPVSTAIA